MNPDGIRILMAGGGTGGHLFPAMTIAAGFKTRWPGASILFAVAGNEFEKRTLAAHAWPYALIAAEGIKGRGKWAKVRSLFKVVRGLWQALGLIRSFRPHLIFGVGGYVTGPVGLAARILGKPLVLHEQNSLPGITNRLLGRLARRIYISFDESRAFFAPAKVLLTGNPVRAALGEKAAAPARAGADSFCVLILGGSQGAHAINLAIAGALPHIGPRPDIRFVHQSGAADAALLESAYAQNKINGQVTPFIEDMAEAYATADLVICRAGATTVAELSMVGRAAILIPFPYAADDHQTVNARSLTAIGAAELIAERDLTPVMLADRIGHYLADRDQLARMGQNARRIAQPAALETIVTDCGRWLAFDHLNDTARLRTGA